MGSTVAGKGKQISFLGVKGGVGTSSLSCLLGRIAVAHRPSLKIGLVDFLPASFSPVPSLLGLAKTEGALESLALHPGLKSPALLESYFSKSPEGLFYLPFSLDGQKEQRADETPRLLREVLAWLDVVLLDLSGRNPADQTFWAEQSNRVVFVSNPDWPSWKALEHWEKRLISRHFDLDACLVLTNSPTNKTRIQNVGGGASSRLKGAAEAPFLGENLPLTLLERSTLPPPLVKSLQQAAQVLLSSEGPWRIPETTPPVIEEAPSAPSPVETAQLETAHQLHRRLLDHFRAEGLLSGPGEMQCIDRRALEPKAREILDGFVQDLDLKEAADRKRLVTEVLHLAFGLGPLEPLVADESVTEIMVNGPEEVYIERRGRLEKSPVRFLNEQQLRTAIERILAPLGRRIDESQPYVDGRLADGSRINAVIPPVSLDGPVLTIRKFAKSKLTISDLIRRESLTRESADFLGACVKLRKNIVVSGGTGSGKTTLLNILSGFIPDNERIVTIEDNAELQLSQDHVVRLEARPANLEGKGRISIRDLVINALRMRPDRIVVGEVRGGEALDMLQAMNTGHDGSLTTAHANSPRDALSRLETMSLMAGLELPMKAIREQIARAVHLVVQQSRLPDGKRAVTRITEVQGMDGEVILLQDLYDWEDSRGLVRRPFAPSFLKDLENQGYRLPDPESAFS